MKPTVAFLYGFGEGPWHGQQIASHFEAAGFQFAADTNQADILVAHSAGSFEVKNHPHAKHVVIVGPPYRPGSLVAANFFRKGRRDATNAVKQRYFGFYLNKTLHNTFYILSDIPKALAVARRATMHDFHRDLSHQFVTVIRPEHDDFSTPDMAAILASLPNVTYIEIPGQHDDLWRHPEPVIELISGFLATDQRA